MALKSTGSRTNNLKKEERKMLNAQNNNNSNNDPKSLNPRMYMGNMPTEKSTRQEMDGKLSKFGKSSEMNVSPLNRREKDDRLPRPSGGRRRPSPPYDDRKRREYRDRSPNRDRLMDDRSRPRDVGRFPREERFREDRVRDPPDGGRRRYEDPVLERRSIASSKDEPFKYRRESETFREQFPDPLEPRSVSYPNDCEVIVPNKQQRSYAEVVELRLKSLGLRVDLLFPHEDTPLTQVLDDISRRGCPLAAVVLPQNEQHKSATVNILWGKPQEHRNMPLDDAVSLVARSYDAHLKAGREKIAPSVRDLSLGALPTVPIEGSLQVLLNLLAEGRPLSVLEIDKIAKHLQDRKEHLLKDSDVPAVLPSHVAGGSLAKSLDQMADKNPQDPQAELQKRILSILNQTPGAASSGGNAARLQSASGNPGSGPNSNNSNWSDSQGDNAQQAGGSGVNFDNPNVQKALDNLIQSGPALLRTIQATGSTGGGMANVGHRGQIGTNMTQLSNVARQQSGGGPRPLLSPPGKNQMPNPNMNNNFGVRSGQQQRHPLLGTLMPTPGGLLGRGNVAMGRF